MPHVSTLVIPHHDVSSLLNTHHGVTNCFPHVPIVLHPPVQTIHHPIDLGHAHGHGGHPAGIIAPVTPQHVPSHLLVGGGSHDYQNHGVINIPGAHDTHVHNSATQVHLASAKSVKAVNDFNFNANSHGYHGSGSFCSNGTSGSGCVNGSVSGDFHGSNSWSIGGQGCHNMGSTGGQICVSGNSTHSPGGHHGGNVGVSLHIPF